MYAYISRVGYLSVLVIDRTLCKLDLWLSAIDWYIFETACYSFAQYKSLGYNMHEMQSIHILMAICKRDY